MSCNGLHFFGLQVSETEAKCGEGLIMRSYAPPAVQQRGCRNPARKMRPQRNCQKGILLFLMRQLQLTKSKQRVAEIIGSHYPVNGSRIG